MKGLRIVVFWIQEIEFHINNFFYNPTKFYIANLLRKSLLQELIIKQEFKQQTNRSWVLCDHENENDGKM